MYSLRLYVTLTTPGTYCAVELADGNERRRSSIDSRLAVKMRDCGLVGLFASQYTAAEAGAGVTGTLLGVWVGVGVGGLPPVLPPPPPHAVNDAIVKIAAY